MTTVDQASTRQATAQQEAVSTQTAVEHDALLEAMHTLERALAAAAPGREAAWAERVSADLPAVRQALQVHQRSSEGPDGVFTEILAVMPQAGFRLSKLREAHAALRAAVEDLLGALAWLREGAPETLETLDTIRGRAATLLTELRSHQAREADLVYEAFCRDLGSVD